jgi:hypothetical protein
MGFELGMLAKQALYLLSHSPTPTFLFLIHIATDVIT